MATQNLKSKADILAKLHITALNDMQLAAQKAINQDAEIILLSPTGTGKTLAFLLPLIEMLDPQSPEIQGLIIVPTRELAIQIEQVARQMGTGYKINAMYGGQNFSKDMQNLKHAPALLIGTPGRVADHLRRKTFDTDHFRYLVLDEFDKALEIGFEEDMEDIIWATANCDKKILTSATFGVEIPSFVKMKNPTVIDYLDEKLERLEIKKIVSPQKDKLETLLKALCHLGDNPGIIFCNYKESIHRISAYLSEKDIAHDCYHGGLEQQDRERALIKFRNGTHRLLIATDLASRGLDIPELKFIIHYHLPVSAEAFVHRNGRTARMNAAGRAYILLWAEEPLPHFIPDVEQEVITPQHTPTPSQWSTLFISGGRQDKISKGDIAGLFIKQGGLQPDEVGVIELKRDCAFVSVKKDMAIHIIATLDNTKIKKRKVRIRVV